MRKPKKILSKADQKKLMIEFQSSGLNKSKYCERVGISESAFYRYQKVHGIVGNFVSISKPDSRKFYVRLFGIKLIQLELSV